MSFLDYMIGFIELIEKNDMFNQCSICGIVDLFKDKRGYLAKERSATIDKIFEVNLLQFSSSF